MTAKVEFWTSNPHVQRFSQSCCESRFISAHLRPGRAALVVSPSVAWEPRDGSALKLPCRPSQLEKGERIGRKYQCRPNPHVPVRDFELALENYLSCSQVIINLSRSTCVIDLLLGSTGHGVLGVAPAKHLFPPKQVQHRQGDLAAASPAIFNTGRATRSAT